MTRLDEIIANALAGIPETDAAILAREVVRLREARAVVVPELTDECAEWQALPFQPQYTPMCGSYFAAGYNLARARAIPADRVLGDGEVKMEICERDCREDEDDALEVLRVCGYGQQAEMLEVAIKAHDLRANQGGADHE